MHPQCKNLARLQAKQMGSSLFIGPPANSNEDMWESHGIMVYGAC